MAPEFIPLYEDLKYLSPLSSQRASVLSEFLAAAAGDTIVDFGCGWAEFLIETLERGPHLTGIGVDLKSDRIDRARIVARQRGVGDRLKLTVGDARDPAAQNAGGIVCIGASQIWGPSVAEDQPLDYRSALAAIRDLLKPGLPAVFGDGIWVAEPTVEAVAPLAGRLDEYVFLPELLDIASKCGFAVIRTHQASLDEWDEFESGFSARYARWLLSHPPDHPEAGEVREKLAKQVNGYYNGYREILGLAYLQLLAI